MKKRFMEIQISIAVRQASSGTLVVEVTQRTGGPSAVEASPNYKVGQ